MSGVLPEVAAWLKRLMFLLPELVGLWDAAKGGTPDQQFRAQFELLRAIKDRQMREELAQLGDDP